MVDPVEAQKNLLAAWEGAGLTRFALPAPLLDRHAASAASSESTTPPPPPGEPAPEPSSDDDDDDDGYYNHPHRDRVMDELMGIRRGKKKKKRGNQAEGGDTATTTAAGQSATPPPEPTPDAPPPKPRGRRPKAPVDAQSQNDVRAIALVDGLTMLGRSDTETRRKVLPSGKPTPIVVGKLDVTEDLAAKMRRTQEYAPRAARPLIICESVKQYRSAAR